MAFALGNDNGIYANAPSKIRDVTFIFPTGFFESVFGFSPPHRALSRALLPPNWYMPFGRCQLI